jgi:hypothetical protein
MLSQFLVLRFLSNCLLRYDSLFALPLRIKEIVQLSLDEMFR